MSLQQQNFRAKALMKKIFFKPEQNKTKLKKLW